MLSKTREASKNKIQEKELKETQGKRLVVSPCVQLHCFGSLKKSKVETSSCRLCDSGETSYVQLLLKSQQEKPPENLVKSFWIPQLGFQISCIKSSGIAFRETESGEGDLVASRNTS